MTLAAWFGSQGMEKMNRETGLLGNMQRVQVAAIVPVYNVERYLEQCLNSLLVQTVSFNRIILVDDGSTDGSGALCDRYSSEYDVIDVVHKSNAGLGYARNTGLDALGDGADYVMFVDSDDWLEPNALECLICALGDTGADCVIGGHTKKDGAGNTRFVLQLENAVYSGEDIRDRVIPRLCGSAPELSDSIPMSAWSTLFRVNCINEYSLRFPSEREMVSEDFVFKFYFLLYSDCVVTSDFTQYCYRTNEESLTRSYRADRFNASIHFYTEVLRAIEDEGLSHECVLRLQKTLFIYLRMCVKQERTRVSRKSIIGAYLTVAEQLSDPTLLSVLKDYPFKRLGYRQRMFVALVRHRASGLLLALSQLGLL